MKKNYRSTVLITVAALVVCAVMMPISVSAAEKSGKTPKITLNSSDPFEFRTIREKKKLLDTAKEYPASFDLRDEGCVTDVKLQNPFGSCWGFAAIGAAETSLLGSGLAAQMGFDASTLDLSEKHLAYFASSYLDMPGFSQNGEGTHHMEGTEASEIYNIGGNPILATNTFASGTGPVFESRDDGLIYKGKAGNVDMRWIDGKYQNFCYSAEDDWSIDKDLRFGQDFVLKESYMLPSPAEIDEETGTYSFNPAGIAAIKEQLYNKRGVEIGFAADTSSPDQDIEEDGTFLSTKTWAHYTWLPTPANHAVQIVGWDDNYSRDNFIAEHRPPEDLFPDGQHVGATDGGNGAWLVKNSWGSGEEDFPNKGDGKWGIKKDGVNTGYFWLSYYDQSISMPEALVFDKANYTEGYYLDQYDFMQAHFIWAAAPEQETKMANVFQAEVSQVLEAVSCQTVSPDTSVTFEVYLLKDTYRDPDDGILVAKMENKYDYGGFHKEKVISCGILEGAPVMIQKGQYYSIVVTQKTSDGKYTVNTPIGYADSEEYPDYDVGIINREESFIHTDGSWEDYADEDVRNSVFKNPGIRKPAFDNFPIKGFCKATGNDISIRMSGVTSLPIFRGQSVEMKVRFTGSGSAVLPDDPEITWTVWDPSESGTKYISIETFDNGSRAVLTPEEEGEPLLIVTVENVGSTVLQLYTYKYYPSIAMWHDHDDESRPLGAVYTGKPVEPGVDICVDIPETPVLIKDKEYTIEYKDNVKCGAGYITVTGIGELGPMGFSELFPIVPQKAEIKSVKKKPGSAVVTVKDQKASGITGYRVAYRESGTEKWKTRKFSSNSNKLTVRGLTAGKSYDITVCGTVSIPKSKRDWTMLDYYDGEMSDIKTIKITDPAKTSIKTLKANKKKGSVTVKWNRAEGISGYQISYSTDKRFRKAARTIKAGKQSSTNKQIKHLKKGKRYYFRIRTYVKTASGIRYSGWSGSKSVRLN